MDCSSRMHGWIGAWVAATALSLPACSKVEPAAQPSSPAGPAGRTTQVAVADSDHPAVDPAVVPASHLFAPPPVPDADPNRQRGPEYFLQDRGTVVELAIDPTDSQAPGTLDDVTAHQHAPRRLPVIEPEEALRIDDDLTALDGPGDLAGDEEVRAAPQLVTPDVWDLAREPEIRRLPATDTGSDVADGAPDLRRLPPVLPEAFSRMDVDAGQRESAELDAESLTDAREDQVGLPIPVAEPEVGAEPSERPSAADVDVPAPADERVEPIVSSESVVEPPSESARESDAGPVESPSDGVVDEDVTDVDSPFDEPSAEKPGGGDRSPELPISGPASAEPLELWPIDVPQDKALMAPDLRRLPPIEVESTPWNLPPAPVVEPDRMLPPVAASAPPDEAIPFEAQAAPHARESTFPLALGPESEADTSQPPSLPGPTEVTVVPPTPAPPATTERWQPVSVPVAALDPGRPLQTVRDDSTYTVVARRAEWLTRRAEDLASRGAYYASRAELIKALRCMTQALDTQHAGTSHSEALAKAMRAFQEAGDFAPRGSQLEGDLNLTQVVSGHRTTVLKGVSVEHLAPMAAQQKYLEYAQQQLVEACGDLSFASQTLYALARVYGVMEPTASGGVDSQMLCLPKAIALHQAALLVDPANAQAANELGVLLARFGQLEDARRVLLHALSLRPAPEIWMNVAAVHQRLGEPELARRAQEEGTRLASRQTTSAPVGTTAVEWVNPREFSQTPLGPGQ